MDGEKLEHVADVFFSLAQLSREVSDSDNDNSQLSLDALQSALEQTAEIRRAMFRHTFPPTALGVRQSTLTHKVHAFLHSLRLEHHTWRDLQKFLDCTFTYTSDMGTEKSFNLASVDIPAFFPYWADGVSNSHLTLEFEGDSFDANADANVPVEGGIGGLDDQESDLPAADIQRLELGGALYLPGVFHVIDNATKDVLKKSEVWEQSAKSMLESVLLFFNASYRRKWFVASCCVGQFRGWSMFFESASPKLEGGRAWGVVSSGISWVLERKVILQRSWRADALLAGAPDEPDEGGQEGAKLLQRVDDAVQSSLFWAFVDMCSTITSMLDDITSWTQGCACHGRQLMAQLKPLLHGHGPLSCPMRGRRAPEVAEGALSRFIDNLFLFNDSQLALVHTAGLEEEERSRLMLDWSAMKVHMRMQFELKLSPWQRLPLSTLGLGHWDLSAARRMVWNCLVEWENLTVEQQELAHPHSKRLCADLRPHALAFVRSEPMDQWVPLQRLRAQAAFAPILEQSIERRHAVLHQHLRCAPHHSAPFVSICERKEEVVEVVSGGKINKLAEVCEQTRTPPAAAEALGLAFHHEFAQHLDVACTLAVSLPHSLVASVVYRCDLGTQYRALQSVHKRPPPPEAMSWPDVQALEQGPESEGAAVSASAEFERQLLQQHAWGHLCSAAGPNDFYSIAAQQALPVDAQPLMLPLRAALSSRAKCHKLPLSLCDGPQGVSVEMNFEHDEGVPDTHASPACHISDELVLQKPPTVSEDSASAAQAQEHREHPYIFFRVIAGNPGRKKLARADCGFQLRSDHVAIEKCDIHDISFEKKQVSVLITAASAPQLFQQPGALASCLLWTVERTKPAFRGGSKLSCEADLAVEALLKAKAGAGDGLQASFDLSVHAPEYASYNKGLQELGAAGLAKSSSTTPDLSSWSLTSHALTNLTQVAVLQNPVSLLRMPAARNQGKDLQQLSILELILRLKDEGFELEACSADSRAEPLPFNTSTCRPKKWYLRDKNMNVCKNYLLALLRPDAVRKNGHEQVRHLRNASYYNELFGAQPCKRGERKKALQREGIHLVADAGAEALEDTGHSSARTKKKRKAQSALADKERAPVAPGEGALALADAHGASASASGQPKSSGRAVHPKSFKWGAASFTFKGPRSYQVTCPRICTHRHAAGKHTACTKTKVFASEEEEALLIRQLKYWVSQASRFASRRDHMNRCQFLTPPSDDELEASKIASDYETEDEERRPVVKRRRIVGKSADVEAAVSSAKAAAKSTAKAKGKSSAKPRPQPKSKGKAKAKAKATAATSSPAPDNPVSDTAEASSSSSSSSGSSSSDSSESGSNSDSSSSHSSSD